MMRPDHDQADFRDSKSFQIPEPKKYEAWGCVYPS